MKIRFYFLSIIYLCMISVPFISAQDDPDNQLEADKFAIEMLYTHFESHYTPKDILHKAQKEAMYIAGEFKKGEKEGKKAIEEFDYPFTRWNNMNGFEPFSQINHYEKGSIVAHPNPALHRIKSFENLDKTFKDHAGRLCILEAWNKVP